MQQAEKLPVTLIDLLTNSIVLRHTAPYLPVRERHRLAATCNTIRDLIYHGSEAWRFLNLTPVKRAIVDSTPVDVGGFSWRAERMDESLTEDDFYVGPLRGIFSSLHSKHILHFVQTLILDGLTVPADVVREVVAEDRYQVRVLGVRESKQLNITKLQQILRYVVRPTREEGTPRLKALYVFGQKDASYQAAAKKQTITTEAPCLGVMSSAGAQIGADWNQRSQHALAPSIFDDESRWYGCNGRLLKRPYSEWAETLQVCRGLISFDAVLCRGPRHDITMVASKDFLQPTIATVALGPEGCQECHTSPEGPATFGESQPDTLPLLAPVSLHSSTVRGCMRPEQREDGTFPHLILRCEDCLRGRWCEQCNRWWCEKCYQEPPSRVSLRTEMQHIEMHEDLQRDGWAAINNAPHGHQVKVFSKLCIERCLVGEMMAGAGSNGMWG